jgi:hypothetical protein
MSVKRIIVPACALAVVAIVIIVLLTRTSRPKEAALAAREQVTEALGTCIAKLKPQCHVLVISNPFGKDAGYLDAKLRYERAALSGLRKGLGRGVPITVVFPDLLPEYFTNRESLFLPPECRTPLSFAIQPASVDRLAEAHRECRVIVSLIGLPAGVEQLKIWGDQDPRCFALLLPDLRVLGPEAKAVEAFQKGKLLAAVDQDAASGAPLIVTRDNVEAVIQRQPKALGY